MTEAQPPRIDCAESAQGFDISTAPSMGRPLPEAGTYRGCRITGCIGGAVVCEALTDSGLAVRHALAPGETPDGFCKEARDTFSAALVWDPRFRPSTPHPSSEES
jgi:hypothetical protein